MFQLRFKSSYLRWVLITCFHHYWIWLFAMYESSCYHSNKNGCFSCSEQGYYFSLEVKALVVSVVSAPSCEFFVLKHVLKTAHTLYWILKRDRMDWICRNLCGKKTGLALWLGFNKLFKILIVDENMEMFMEDAKIKVSFFNSTVLQLTS